MKQTENSKVIQFAALLLIGVLTVYIMVEARVILLPLMWAFFISLIILPAVKWMEKKSIPRY